MKSEVAYRDKQLVEEKYSKASAPLCTCERSSDLGFDKNKEFQRLRRIKQLGTLYLAFHSAEHSRFNHSLVYMRLSGA